MTDQTHTIEITQTIRVDVCAPRSTDATQLALAWARWLVERKEERGGNLTLNGLEQKVKVVTGKKYGCNIWGCRWKGTADQVHWDGNWTLCPKHGAQTGWPY